MSQRRTPPPPKPGLQLTPPDRQIIEAVHRYRFLTTDDIARLTGTTSRGKLNSRLRELWGNQYLDRPDIQWTMFA